MHCSSLMMPRYHGDYDCFLSSLYHFTVHDYDFPRVVYVGKCLSPFTQRISLLTFILVCTHLHPRNADSQLKTQVGVTAYQADPTPKCCCWHHLVSSHL